MEHEASISLGALLRNRSRRCLLSLRRARHGSVRRSCRRSAGLWSRMSMTGRRCGLVGKPCSSGARPQDSPVRCWRSGPASRPSTLRNMKQGMRAHAQDLDAPAIGSGTAHRDRAATLAGHAKRCTQLCTTECTKCHPPFVHSVRHRRGASQGERPTWPSAERIAEMNRLACHQTILDAQGEVGLETRIPTSRPDLIDVLRDYVIALPPVRPSGTHAQPVQPSWDASQSGVAAGRAWSSCSADRVDIPAALCPRSSICRTRALCAPAIACGCA